MKTLALLEDAEKGDIIDLKSIHETDILHRGGDRLPLIQSLQLIVYILQSGHL